MSIVKFLLAGSVTFSGFMWQNIFAYADDVYSTQYRISVIGLTIARANIKTRIGKNSYDLKADFASSGIARIFDQTDGNLSIFGKVNKGSFWPNYYQLRYQHKKKVKSTTIRFNNGRVTDIKNAPAIKKRDPWVALTETSLQNVFDPISAMMIGAQSPQEVCTKVLKTFDGQTRADLRLIYSGKGHYSARGFKGETVICTARFVPVAGYQKDKESINYLANRSRISISFATVGNSGIYVPVEAQIGTKIGTVKISATRFDKVN